MQEEERWTASDIMTPGPACCAADAPLSAVAKLMVQHNCGRCGQWRTVSGSERLDNIVAR
jgi:CBS domain-containing protein